MCMKEYCAGQAAKVVRPSGRRVDILTKRTSGGGHNMRRSPAVLMLLCERLGSDSDMRRPECCHPGCQQVGSIPINRTLVAPLSLRLSSQAPPLDTFLSIPLRSLLHTAPNI